MSDTPVSPVLATAEDVRACFRLLLGRAPNAEEWTGHVAASVGKPLAGVVANYAGSAEFARRGLTRPPEGAIRLMERAGYRMYVPVEDEAVGRHVAHGVYEPHVAGVLTRLLQPGMGLLDIGANIGVFSLLGASLVGPGGWVLAMEPNPVNARLLAASRLANGFAQLTVCQAAAGEAVGVAALHSFQSNGTVTAAGEAALLQSSTVAVLPIDTLVPPGQAVAVIKIDVEGAELLALRGAAGTIGRCRPVIVSEFSPGQLSAVSGVSGAAYLGYLQAAGYELAVLPQEGDVTAAVSAEAVMAAYEGCGVDHIDIVAWPAERPAGCRI